MSKKASDLPEWYAARYREAVGIDAAEGGASFKKFVDQFPVRSSAPNFPVPTTGRQRMSSFLSLKLRYPMGSAGYSCLVMSARIGETTSHYAYVYWRRNDTVGAKPEYICVSPTYDSRDGEYRRRFIRYPVFESAYEKYIKEIAPFEEATLEMVGDGTLSLRATAYPDSEFITEVSRLPIMAFAVSQMMDLIDCERGTLMLHTNPDYAKILTAVSKKNPSLVTKSIEVAMTSQAINIFRRGVSDQFAVRCGQKLTPMYVREVVQTSDYNLAAWRELAVTRLVSDLVINYVTPSFAMHNQWSYIEGADPALFDNAAMEDRYVRGKAIAEAARSLREARRILGEPGLNQNYHTEDLNAQLYESLEYAQSYLLMSPIALLNTMEDVGVALRSVGTAVRKVKSPWPAIADAFADADTAARHIFELTYGAHCMHTKMGVAHTDLHGNNITLYMWGIADKQTIDASGKITYTSYYDDPVVAFVAGPRGEADTYVFPAAGDSCCIIDFSRAILGPGFRTHLEEGRTPQYATNFYRDQVNRVMRTLHRYAPSIVEKNQESIKAAVLANFDAVFPILCAVDFISIGRSVAAALAEDATLANADVDQNPFVVSKRAIELATKLENAAHEILVSGLHDLAESAGARKQMRIPPFPGSGLLEKVFGEWQFASWQRRDAARVKGMQLVDAYNYNNATTYSGSDYARYPPWARLDEIEKHLGGYKLTDLFERGVEPFLESLQPGARVEVIAERLRAEQERLDGKPMSTASSWIDE